MRALILTCFTACLVWSQPAAGSITTHGIPHAGHYSINPAGNVFIVSSDVAGATPGAAQTQTGGGTCIVSNSFFPGLEPCQDAYIAKTDSSGNLVFATLLGGPKNDFGTAIAADAAGSVYVTGTTEGSFPATAGAAIAASTTSRTFAAKLSADGAQFVYATYLPDAFSYPLAIAVDSSGNAYVAGRSVDSHAIVIKISADGSSIEYSAVLAGSNGDAAFDVAADAQGNAFVAGYTQSPDFPVTAGAVQARLGGLQNAFLTKLNASGAIAASTFLGGSVSDQGTSVKLGADGAVFVAGIAQSLDFPTTAGTFQSVPVVPAWSTFPGGFIAKLQPNLSQLIYFTYLPDYDSSPIFIAVGASGDLFAAGVTGATLPLTASGPQQCFGGAVDAFAVHLDASGALLDSTYLGGPHMDFANQIAVASDGTVLLAATLSSQSPIQYRLAKIRFGDPGWLAPACMSPDVLNSGTLFGVLDLTPTPFQVTPGELVTFTGLGIGPGGGWVAAPDTTGHFPTDLHGVRVWFDGVPAPISYAQSNQVNAQVPFSVTGPTTIVTLQYASTNGFDPYKGGTFGPFTIPVRLAAPGLLRAQPNVSALAYALNQDGTLNSPSNPAAVASFVAVWGTGFGTLNPTCPTGGQNPPDAVNLASSAVSFSYKTSMPVAYAGSAPGFACGVTQINLQVPAVPSGPFTIYTSVANGGYSIGDPIGATIYVK